MLDSTVNIPFFIVNPEPTTTTSWEASLTQPRGLTWVNSTRERGKEQGCACLHSYKITAGGEPGARGQHQPLEH